MKQRLLTLLCLLCCLSASTAWADTKLFHEGFGDNSGSARVWDDSYKEQSGIAAVYKNAAYTIKNAKQSKNTVGSVLSGLLQTTINVDAVLLVGPIDLSECTNVKLSYSWKAASIKETYNTNVYYSTSASGEFIEIPNTAAGKTSFVNVSVNVPTAALVTNAYFKVVFNTSNAQAIIDEFDLSGTYNGTVVEKVKTPTFTPAAGEYYEAQNVTIACETEGAKIYYTTDGTDPTTESLLYEGAIAVSETTTIKAIAVKDGMTTSDVATATYTINQGGKITPELKFEPQDVTAYLDALDEFNAPVLTTDPAGLKVKYTISDEEVATIDDDGTLHFNAAGTATVTATFAGNEEYNEATATYTLKVVANKPNFVMLVAKAQNGKYYAMSSETGVGKNSLKAIEINVDNYEAMKGESKLLWVINVNNNKATICNAGNSQYLAKGSGNTDLKTQTGTYDWTWDDSHQYGSMETGTTTKTKRTYLGIVDGNDAYFKNYAESNLGNGSYFTTLTMPDFINKLRKVDVETLDKDHINAYVESGTTNVSNEVQLLDGISINVEDNVSVEKLVYNRTFTATQANTWQPFFVPFTINTAELPEGAIVAEMDKVTYAADDDDNVTYTLVWKPATGELAANKPYIIHLGSEEAVANFDFVSKNAELQTTDCTEQAVLSFTTEDNAKFEFWGTYEPITNMKTAFGGNSYVLSSGQFVHPKDNVVLKPFRYYLLFKPNASGKSNMIIKNVINDETEGIEEIMIEDTSDNVYIDLMGRRIENPTSGIYIHKGKKVFVK